MSDVLSIETISQLEQYLNQEGIMEIVLRGKHRRIKEFQKVALTELKKSEEREVAEKVLQALDKNSADFAMKMQNVVCQQQLGMVLNGLNLCATCAGFSIIYKELMSISSDISSQLDKLHATVKQGHMVQAGFELNSVISDYHDMLDRRKREKPYSEEEMRRLVDHEYNVLIWLIDLLRNDIIADKKTVIESIFSLLAMFTISLCYFDEQYYFNNRELLSETHRWHSSHDRWMDLFGTLTDSWFAVLLQDYGIFDAGMNTVETDIYYNLLIEQVMDLQEEVQDNQMLITSLDNIEFLRAVHQVTTAEIIQSVSNAIAEAAADSDEGVVDKLRFKMFEQIGAV